MSRLPKSSGALPAEMHKEMDDLARKHPTFLYFLSWCILLFKRDAEAWGVGAACNAGGWFTPPGSDERKGVPPHVAWSADGGNEKRWGGAGTTPPR